MGNEKRERKKANREAKLAAQAAAEARAKRLKFIRNALIFAVAVVVVAVLLAGCGTDDDDAADTPASTAPTSNQSTEPAANPGGDQPAPEPGADDPPAVETECPPVEGVAEPVTNFAAAPSMCIDASAAYTARFDTSEGEIVVELDTELTPTTTNNFVVLARYGYYDQTDLHRIIASAGIVQGGSPHTQDSADPGPGYTIADEALPFTTSDYAPGALAMARTAAPDSAGAQFFFVAHEGGRYLGDPNSLGDSAGSYVVFGQVTEGLEVVEAINSVETDASDTPTRQILVNTITIDGP